MTASNIVINPKFLHICNVCIKLLYKSIIVRWNVFENSRSVRPDWATVWLPIAGPPRRIHHPYSTMKLKEKKKEKRSR